MLFYVYFIAMSIILWFTVVSLLLHVAHSYILLTANMDDVQSVVKQMASSPVVDQVKKIWRRASNQFLNELNKPKIRLRHKEDPESDKEAMDRSEEEIRRRSMDVLVSLSENATHYINSVKDVLQDLVA